MGDERGELRRLWDERHRERVIESPEPNPVLVAEATAMMPGSALDLGCGDGTNAIWLARRGWRVTGIDWSEVALGKAQAATAAAGLHVDWVQADLLSWSPGGPTYDLVTLIYLHLSPDERRSVYATAIEAVAPGGHLLVVGHDSTNLTQGVGGPQDPERLFTADEIGRELRAVVADLEIERAEAVRQSAGPERSPIDAVLVARRPA
jgi:SAM-dependent methyltransferase